MVGQNKEQRLFVLGETVIKDSTFLNYNMVTVCWDPLYTANRTAVIRLKNLDPSSVSEDNDIITWKLVPRINNSDLTGMNSVQDYTNPKQWCCVNLGHLYRGTEQEYVRGGRNLPVMPEDIFTMGQSHHSRIFPLGATMYGTKDYGSIAQQFQQVRFHIQFLI